MHESEIEVRQLAARQLGLASRRQALEAGMAEWRIQYRLTAEHWRPVLQGVYLLGVTDPTWHQKLMAACLFAGPAAAASHRAGAVLWQVDGLVRAPVEILLPHGEEAVARGVVVHRSRRFDERDITRRAGIPVTIIERTLVDVARYLEPRETEKALESALRRNLTTPAAVWRYVEDRGGRIPGTRRLRAILLSRGAKPPAGSGGEVELLRALRAAGVPDPVRQHPLKLENGRIAILDVAWPWLRLGLEYDGYDVHGGRLAHADDMERQNAIVALGWTLLRYGSRVRRDPQGVANEVAAALARLNAGGLVST